MAPCVSVVLPVYNVADYIVATITSILEQTFTDFELIVLDDCSTDDTAARVQSIKDPRLRFVQNPRNLGRAGTDNAAIPYVRGEFVAKMDGDDLCHPERFAKQVAFLRQHPEVNMVGCWLQNFGASNYLHRYPTEPNDLRVLTLFTLPGGNNCYMLRASLLREQGLHYDANLRQTEDYDFCARYLRQLVIATIPEALVEYRVLPRRDKQPILDARAVVSGQVQKQLFENWQLPASPRELRIHGLVSLLDQPLGDITLPEIEQWLLKLLRHNEQQVIFDSAALRHGVGERWFEVCYTYKWPRLTGLLQYRRSPLAAYWSLTSKKRVAFGVRALRNF